MQIRNSLSVLFAILGLDASVSLASASTYDPAPLKYEHPGQLFRSVSSSTCCVNGVLTDGNSTGEFKDIAGSAFYHCGMIRVRGTNVGGSQYLPSKSAQERQRYQCSNSLLD